nr:MAG TPA: hypothetical protein [Caudoviricetes sp.]
MVLLILQHLRSWFTEVPFSSSCLPFFLLLLTLICLPCYAFLCTGFPITYLIVTSIIGLIYVFNRIKFEIFI